MCMSYEEYDPGIINGTVLPVSIPEKERYTHRLTQMADRAATEGDYAEVCRLKRELASICCSQGKYGDAYQLMREAFFHEQMWIYQQADIPVKAFVKLPYVEKLKDVLDEAAGWAEVMEQTDYAVSFRQLKARVCRVQGMEQEASQLDRASYSLLEKAGRASDMRRFPDAEIEEKCLKLIARKYETKLSADTERTR